MQLPGGLSCAGMMGDAQKFMVGLIAGNLTSRENINARF